MNQCIQLTAIAALLALVIIVVYIYAWLLLMGADTRGAYGIIWSILPSFILTLVGWYMKWKFYREQELQEVLNNGYSPLETDSDSIEEMV
jgi:type VI protein secretion system component VasK